MFVEQRIEKKKEYVQDNDLITSCYHLPLAAKRLLMLAINKVDSTGMPKNAVITLYASEWQEYFGHRSNAWRQMKQAAQILYDATIYFPLREEGTRKQRWVENCDYWPKQGKIGFQFTRVVETYLANQQDNFTPVDLLLVKDMQSVYSIRLFEQMSRFKDTGWYQVNVEQLRDMLKLGDKYPKYAEFRRNVIEPAKKEIEARTPYRISYNPIAPKGRKVTAVKFSFVNTALQ